MRKEQAVFTVMSSQQPRATLAAEVAIESIVVGLGGCSLALPWPRGQGHERTGFLMQLLIKIGRASCRERV